MTRVLVTGGCGFVGVNLVEALQAAGHDEITLLDDESVGRREHVDSNGVGFLKGDIRDAELVERAVAGADAVVHLAADTRVIDSLENPSKNFDINVVGTLTILEAMRRHGRRRIINASTGGAILGDVPPPVHERMLPRPISPYGASKLAVEGYLSAYEGGFGMAPISFRFANVYGPRSFHKGSVVAAFMKAILRDERIPIYGDGEQTRDFVFVRDLTSAVADAVGHEETGVFQLGSGRPTSVNELLRLLSDVVGEDLFARVDYLPPRQGEVAHTYCDVSLARDRLGFAPDTPLHDGLTETWRWFQENWTAR
jgi:UDP-glucose 4-epimerase